MHSEPQAVPSPLCCLKARDTCAHLAFSGTKTSASAQWQQQWLLSRLPDRAQGLGQLLGPSYRIRWEGTQSQLLLQLGGDRRSRPIPRRSISEVLVITTGSLGGSLGALIQLPQGKPQT